MTMAKKLIFGHKNPDTDSICSALAYESLKKQLNEDVEAVRLGSLNKETEFALGYANVTAPRLIEKVEDSIEEVILVDHNEFQQSVDNIRDVKIVEVIDHHRVANFETSDPLYFRVEPVGCTATILTKMFREHEVNITKEDEQIAQQLAKIAEVDINQYGLDMLKAGTDLSDKTVAELLSMDAKEFTMGDAKVEIAQVNTVDISEIYEQQTDLEAEMNQI